MRLPGNSNSECLPGLHSHSVPAGCQVPPRPLIRLSCDTFPGGPRGTALPCMSSQCSIDYEDQAVPNSPAHNGVYTIFRIEGRFSDLRDGNRKAGRSPKGDRPTLDWSVYFLRGLPLAGVNQCIALGSSGAWPPGGSVCDAWMAGFTLARMAGPAGGIWLALHAVFNVVTLSGRQGFCGEAKR